MRVLLSTIGSRGEVQPVLALASELRALGQDVRLCVPPDFRDLLDELGFDVVPVGPPVRGTASAHRTPPTEEQIRRAAEATVTTQFETIGAAAEGCDVLVAAGALQFATRSIAERTGAAYVYAGFCPITLPSDLHAPPPMPWRTQGDNRALWDEDARRWNTVFGPKVAEYRAAAGQAPVDDLPRHVFGDRPWLAADPALAPWPAPGDPRIVQTGAWIWPDERPLPPELADFLDAGEPPVYFGFGSMRAPAEIAERALVAARAHGRRAIVARGWADLAAPDAPDCLGIGEVNQQALFARVAAVVHHGGAGTTTAAARAGAPQVVVPQMYDQHYFAGRVRSLGLGAATEPGVPTAEALTSALGVARESGAEARAFAGKVRTSGASIAARHLLTTVPLASA